MVEGYDTKVFHVTLTVGYVLAIFCMGLELLLLLHVLFVDHVSIPWITFSSYALTPRRLTSHQPADDLYLYGFPGLGMSYGNYWSAPRDTCLEVIRVFDALLEHACITYGWRGTRGGRANNASPPRCYRLLFFLFVPTA